MRRVASVNDEVQSHDVDAVDHLRTRVDTLAKDMRAFKGEVRSELAALRDTTAAILDAVKQRAPDGGAVPPMASPRLAHQHQSGAIYTSQSPSIYASQAGGAAHEQLAILVPNTLHNGGGAHAPVHRIVLDTATAFDMSHADSSPNRSRAATDVAHSPSQRARNLSAAGTVNTQFTAGTHFPLHHGMDDVPLHSMDGGRMASHGNIYASALDRMSVASQRHASQRIPLPQPAGEPAAEPTMMSHRAAASRGSASTLHYLSVPLLGRIPLDDDADGEQRTWRSWRVLPVDGWAELILDVIYVVSTVLTCGASLFPVHFYDRHGAEAPHHFPFGLCVGWFVTSQVIALAWFVSRFFTPIPDPANSYLVLETVGKILNAKTKDNLVLLLFDAICALPIDFVFIGWAWRAYFALQLRHFLKIGRFVFLGYRCNPLSPIRYGVRLLSFACLFALTIHTIAVVFWVLEPGVTHYVTALYWAVTTVTTVGYGDVAPTGEGDRMFASFVMIVAVGMTAALTAFATVVLSRRDKRMEKENELKGHMHSMVRYYELPWTDQRSLMAFFPSLLDQQNEAQFSELVAGLPEDQRRHVTAYVNAKFLRHLRVFRRMNDERALLALCAVLNRRLIPERTLIMQQGEVGHEMFFLVRGKATWVYVGPAVGNIERRPCPSIFGQLALVEHCNRRASVVAATPCELLVLVREDYERVVEPHPQLSALISFLAEEQRQEQRDAEVSEAARFLAAETPAGNLTQEGIIVLAEHLEPVVVPKDTVILDANHLTDCMYFVVGGVVAARPPDSAATAHGAESPGEGATTSRRGHSGRRSASPPPQGKEGASAGGNNTSFHRGAVFGQREMIVSAPVKDNYVAVTPAVELLRLTHRAFVALETAHVEDGSLQKFVESMRTRGRPPECDWVTLDAPGRTGGQLAE